MTFKNKEEKVDWKDTVDIEMAEFVYRLNVEDEEEEKSPK